MVPFNISLLITDESYSNSWRYNIKSIIIKRLFIYQFWKRCYTDSKNTEGHQSNNQLGHCYSKSDMAAFCSKIKIDKAFLSDNGGRRMGIDRRNFRYDFHIPERRSGREQRIVQDRRVIPRHQPKD